MTFYQIVETLMEKLEWPTNNTSKLDQAKMFVNQAKDEFVMAANWVTRIKTDTFDTVASTSEYNPFPDLDKMLYLRQTNTAQRLGYVNPVDFFSAEPNPTAEADPSFYYINGSDVNEWPTIGLYPIPSSAITMYACYVKKVKDLYNSDHTTGYISVVTNASTSVVGSGTNWISSMAGRFIKVKSDGNWYKIASISDSTHMELSSAYQGTTIASGASTDLYIIGELYSGIKEAWNSIICQGAILLATQYDQQMVDLYAQTLTRYENLLNKAKKDNQVELDKIHVLKDEDYNTETRFVRIADHEVG
jgi:hypothetical protein